ncbi:hypothetical protein GCM10027447_30290 [Glycomyces halotolerans]
MLATYPLWRSSKRSLTESLKQLRFDVRKEADREALQLGLVDSPIMTELVTEPAAGTAPRSPTDVDLGRSITITDMVDEWKSDPKQRFVILGDSGSGKTSVLVRMLWSIVRDHRRDAVAPVPVLVSVGDWDPQTPFHEWFQSQVERLHPYLKHHYPKWRRGAGTIAEHLIDEGKIVPFLDGFDEITDQDGRRRAAMRNLNRDPVFATLPLVLACRATEYRATAASEFHLQKASVYTLKDLDWQLAAAYLCRSEPTEDRPTVVPEQWEPVVDKLANIHKSGKAQALSKALSTPLMVFLARAAFEDDERSQPKELLRFNSRGRIEDFLAAAYVENVYRSGSRGGRKGDRRAREAILILGFVARYLREKGTSDLAWWEMPPPNRRRRPARLVWFQLAGVIAYSILLPVVAFRSMTPEMPVSQIPFEASGLFWFNALTWIFLAGRLIDRTQLGVMGPYGSYRTDRNLLISRLFTLAVPFLWLLLVMHFWARGDAHAFVVPSWSYFVFAPPLAIVVAWMFVPSAAKELSVYLWSRRREGRLPWGSPFMKTLEDARERQILRSTGGVYQFRHAVIQNHLARSPAPGGDSVGL